MSAAKPSRLRRVLIILAVLYLFGTVLGGMGLGWIALHPPSHAITASEERNVRAAAEEDSVVFRDVELQASDNAVLRGWFMRPRDPNGNVVILLHGVSDNRLGMYGYGKWFLANHYSVLLPDARGHSLSTGLATYGLHEADDIHRWIDWIETAEHPNCVFGLGESMGAAQLLQALPDESRLCAVVAESPFATFREVAYARFGREFHTGPWLGRTFFHPTVDAGFLYVRLRYGQNMEDASPARAVEGSTIPIFLIHGLSDRNIPNYHSEIIRSHNPEDIELWKVPGAGHTGAHATAPEEFERRVLNWFTSHPRSPVSPRAPRG